MGEIIWLVVCATIGCMVGFVLDNPLVGALVGTIVGGIITFIVICKTNTSDVFAYIAGACEDLGESLSDDND